MKPQNKMHKATPPSNVVQLRPGVPARGALQHAWESANKEERAEFLLALETSEGVILARPQAAPMAKPEPPMTTLYRIIVPGLTHFDYNEIITTSELLAAQQKYASDSFKIKAVELQKTVDDFLNEVKQPTAPKPLSDLLHKPTPKPLSEWQHGSNIDSMPIEAALPPIEHPPVEAIPPSEPPPNEDDDDDAADWWKELQTK